MVDPAEIFSEERQRCTHRAGNYRRRDCRPVYVWDCSHLRVLVDSYPRLVSDQWRIHRIHYPYPGLLIVAMY